MITKPIILNSAYIQGYISIVEGNDLIRSLSDSMNRTYSIYNNIPENRENYAYAAGKWTVKDVLAHIIDTERVFSYRAHVFSRKDKTELPGFEQNDYALYTNAANRKLKDMIAEYMAVREATIRQFQSFGEEMLDYTGIANKLEMTPRILGWMIAGHNEHHNKVLQEKYLF